MARGTLPVGASEGPGASGRPVKGCRDTPPGGPPRQGGRGGAGRRGRRGGPESPTESEISISTTHWEGAPDVYPDHPRWAHPRTGAPRRPQTPPNPVKCRARARGAMPSHLAGAGARGGHPPARTPRRRRTRQLMGGLASWRRRLASWRANSPVGGGLKISKSARRTTFAHINRPTYYGKNACTGHNCVFP